jgi:hypothetical protein
VVCVLGRCRTAPGLSCKTKHTDCRKLWQVQNTGDAGVPCLGVLDGGEHCRQIRYELLGVEVLLQDIWKNTRRRDRLVLLREVGLESCGVFACDLEAPKFLELVHLKFVRCQRSVCCFSVKNIGCKPTLCLLFCEVVYGTGISNH